MIEVLYFAIASGVIALIYGLMGHQPEDACPQEMHDAYRYCAENKQLKHRSGHVLVFDPQKQIIFNYKDLLPLHVNGMRFRAYRDELLVEEHIAYSIGGGFVVHCEDGQAKVRRLLPFDRMAELKEQINDSGLTLYDYLLSQLDLTTVDREIEEIWQAMRICIEKGLAATGELPGGLKVQRRASKLFADLNATQERGWSFDCEERFIGMSCVGSAIYDETGQPVAGVSISGPSNRFDPSSIADFGATVKDAAEEITRLSGGELPR